MKVTPQKIRNHICKTGLKNFMIYRLIAILHHIIYIPIYLIRIILVIVYNVGAIAELLDNLLLKLPIFSIDGSIKAILFAKTIRRINGIYFKSKQESEESTKLNEHIPICK